MIFPPNKANKMTKIFKAYHYGLDFIEHLIYIGTNEIFARNLIKEKQALGHNTILIILTELENDKHQFDTTKTPGLL